MFTGIVSDIGEVKKLTGKNDLTATIACGYGVDTIDIGASIACSGVCLTVVEKGKTNDDRSWFSVDISAETIDKTMVGSWNPGTLLNLERALKVGDELGGHMVSGHVDCVADIIETENIGDSRKFRLEVGPEFARFIAQKGSVCLDGVSLTVNDVAGHRFDVNLIPHTLVATTWGKREVGDKVNLEIDVIARYVARLNEELDV